MNNVYLLGGRRSPIGIKNGQFKNLPPEIIGSMVLKQVIEDYQLKDIDEIIGGNVVGTGGNMTRLMALTAGVPEEVPAYTVDMQCASGMMSVDLAYQKIKSGQCDLIIAGGFESTSLQPFKCLRHTDPRYQKNPNPFTVSAFSPDEWKESAMLEGAERVAKIERITKAELDFWVKKSHENATRAAEKKALKDLIVPILGKTKDEGIRKNISQKLLDKVPSLVTKEGVINSSNACLMHDGAAFVVLCSQRYLTHHSIKPIAKLIASTLVAGKAKLSPKLAIQAIDQLLVENKLHPEQIKAFEVNEAFAVIDVLFQRAYPNCLFNYNLNGGALAYGHPYGASGAIILLHLLKALDEKGDYGVASVAAAGGLGVALLVEKV